LVEVNLSPVYRRFFLGNFCPGPGCFLRQRPLRLRLTPPGLHANLRNLVPQGPGLRAVVSAAAAAAPGTALLGRGLRRTSGLVGS
jgi:hypothetical protein